MKKVFSFILILTVIASCLVIFTSCGNSESTTITGYLIDASEYSIGDAFSTDDIVVKAKLSNGKEEKVTKNIVVDVKGCENFPLGDDGKITDIGDSVNTFKLSVYKFEIRDDFKIGEWIITIL